MKNKNRLYADSINKWGIITQLGMLSEECSELAVASLHMTRTCKPEALNELAEEIVDAQFMIDEIREYFSDNSNLFKEMLQKYKKEKLERLNKLLYEE